MATKARKRHKELLAGARADQEASLRSLQMQLARLVDEAPDEVDTDFSEEGGDPDVNIVERDRLRAQLIEAREHLEAIERAEAAVEEGTYGTCHVCGETIPEERLEVLPATRLCVQCKAAGHLS